MDVAHPIRSVVPTLEGPVLEVLARTTRPLTGLEVHRLAGVGSPNGVRLALARLADQGLVRVEQRGAAIIYTGNRDHLAWPAVDHLARLRAALIDRLRARLEEWQPPPLHASIYGSAARGDGDARSDIDVLLIRPENVREESSPWADQVDLLRDEVHAWTGNHCQVFQLDRARLEEYVRVKDDLVQGWLRDGIAVAGPGISSILRTLPRAPREA